MDAADDQRPKAATVHDLTGAVRGLVLLIGLCGLVAGGVAVFSSANQAGTVGLLIVGAVAVLLAIVGRVPLRWVIGGNEFDMTKEAAAVAADAVASQLGPESTAALTAQLLESNATRSSSMTAAMVDRVVFERSASARILTAVTGLGWECQLKRYSDSGVDVIVTNREGRVVEVVFKLIGTTAGFYAFVDSVDSDRHPRIYVVSSLSSLAVPERTAVRRAGEAGIHIVPLDAPDFDSRFVAACSAIFANSVE